MSLLLVWGFWIFLHSCGTHDATYFGLLPGHYWGEIIGGVNYFGKGQGVYLMNVLL